MTHTCIVQQSNVYIVEKRFSHYIGLHTHKYLGTFDKQEHIVVTPKHHNTRVGGCKPAGAPTPSYTSGIYFLMLCNYLCNISNTNYLFTRAFPRPFHLP